LTASPTLNKEEVIDRPGTSVVTGTAQAQGPGRAPGPGSLPRHSRRHGLAGFGLCV